MHGRILSNVIRPTSEAARAMRRAGFGKTGRHQKSGADEQYFSASRTLAGSHVSMNAK